MMYGVLYSWGSCCVAIFKKMSFFLHQTVVNRLKLSFEVKQNLKDIFFSNLVMFIFI